MTREQIEFLNNMTSAQAEAVISKFKSDPAIAAERSDAAYIAFCQAWEMLHPTEYIQRVRRARANGGDQYHFISLI